jgi:hypothetical protein
MGKPRRKWLRRTLIILAVAVPLILGAGLWFGAPWFVKRAVQTAMVQVGDILDADISAESVKFERFDRIILKNVEVVPRGGRKGAAPLLRVARVEADVEITSWFSMRVRVVKVVLDGSNVTVLRMPNGTDNFTEFRRRLTDWVRRRGALSDTDSRSSGLWKRIEPFFPKVVVTGATLHIEDRTPKRTLLPAYLPATVDVRDLKVDAVNDSILADALKLKVKVSGRISQLDAGLKASLSFDRDVDDLDWGLTVVGPIRREIGGHQFEVGSVSIGPTGPIRIENVKLGSLVSAKEVNVTLLGAPGSGTDAKARLEGGLAGLNGVVRLVVVEPEFRLKPLLEQLGKVKVPAPVAGGAREPVVDSSPKTEHGAERPRLRKREGQKVREALRRYYRKLVRRSNRLALLVQRLGGRYRLPELVIRRGRFIAGDAAPRFVELIQGLQGFSAQIRRDNGGLLTATVILPKRGAGLEKAEDKVELRAQLDTGDFQVHLAIADRLLAPFRSLLPVRMSVGPTSRIKSTDLRLVYSTEAKRMEVQGRWSVDNLTLDVPGFVGKPMTGISMGGQGSVVVDVGNAAVSLTGSTFRLGRVPIETALTIRELTGEPVLTWSFALKSVPIQQIVDALPTEFLGRLEGVRITGQLDWRLNGSLDTRDMRSLHYQSRVDTQGFNVLDMGKYVDLRSINSSFAHRVQLKNGQMHEFVTGPTSPGWVSLGAVSPHMAKVLSVTEDGTFWRHHGVAFFALRSAIINNLQRGRFFRGGSTLTMQLVKNLFLTHEKTFSRKTQELFLAHMVEEYLTKRRILELYLNIVELGPNVYGIRRAARYYFGKSPAQLDVLECAFIASLLPSPRRYHRQFKRGRVSRGWQKKLKRILQTMLKRSKITEQQFLDAAPYSPVFRGQRRPPKPPDTPDNDDTEVVPTPP